MWREIREENIRWKREKGEQEDEKILSTKFKKNHKQKVNE